ncbi:hypothetical protein OAN22_01500 [Alphaproteobacteria bacterium]|nr:hypothetical protein [Alphaproteobacteria bacterium]
MHFLSLFFCLISHISWGASTKLDEAALFHQQLAQACSQIYGALSVPEKESWYYTLRASEEVKQDPFQVGQKMGAFLLALPEFGHDHCQHVFPASLISEHQEKAAHSATEAQKSILTTVIHFMASPIGWEGKAAEPFQQLETSLQQAADKEAIVGLMRHFMRPYVHALYLTQLYNSALYEFYEGRWELIAIKEKHKEKQDCGDALKALYQHLIGARQCFLDQLDVAVMRGLSLDSFWIASRLIDVSALSFIEFHRLIKAFQAPAEAQQKKIIVPVERLYKELEPILVSVDPLPRESRAVSENPILMQRFQRAGWPFQKTGATAEEVLHKEDNAFLKTFFDGEDRPDLEMPLERYSQQTFEEYMVGNDLYPKLSALLSTGKAVAVRAALHGPPEAIEQLQGLYTSLQGDRSALAYRSFAFGEGKQPAKINPLNQHDELYRSLLMRVIDFFPPSRFYPADGGLLEILGIPLTTEGKLNSTLFRVAIEAMVHIGVWEKSYKNRLTGLLSQGFEPETWAAAQKVIQDQEALLSGAARTFYRARHPLPAESSASDDDRDDEESPPKMEPFSFAVKVVPPLEEADIQKRNKPSVPVKIDAQREEKALQAACLFLSQMEFENIACRGSSFLSQETEEVIDLVNELQKSEDKVTAMNDFFKQNASRPHWQGALSRAALLNSYDHAFKKWQTLQSYKGLQSVVHRFHSAFRLIKPADEKAPFFADVFPHKKLTMKPEKAVLAGAAESTSSGADHSDSDEAFVKKPVLPKEKSVETLSLYLVEVSQFSNQSEMGAFDWMGENPGMQQDILFMLTNGGNAPGTKDKTIDHVTCDIKGLHRMIIFLAGRTALSPREKAFLHGNFSAVLGLIGKSKMKKREKNALRSKVKPVLVAWRH